MISSAERDVVSKSATKNEVDGRGTSRTQRRKVDLLYTLHASDRYLSTKTGSTDTRRL